MDLDLARKPENYWNIHPRKFKGNHGLHNYIRMQAFVVDIVANTHTLKISNSFRFAFPRSLSHVSCSH